MRGVVATAAVVGVLAIGGLPALALILGTEETGRDTAPTTTLVEDTDRPPGWARAHSGSPHGHAVREWAHCLAGTAGGRHGAADHCVKPVPPGHLKRSGASGAQGGSAGRQDRDEPPGRAGKPEKTKKPKAGRPD